MNKATARPVTAAVQMAAQPPARSGIMVYAFRWGTSGRWAYSFELVESARLEYSQDIPRQWRGLRPDNYFSGTFQIPLEDVGDWRYIG